jgi:hypothetical protein
LTLYLCSLNINLLKAEYALYRKLWYKLEIVKRVYTTRELGSIYNNASLDVIWLLRNSVVRKMEGAQFNKPRNKRNFKNWPLIITSSSSRKFIEKVICVHYIASGLVSYIFSSINYKPDDELKSELFQESPLQRSLLHDRYDIVATPIFLSSKPTFFGIQAESSPAQPRYTKSNTTNENLYLIWVLLKLECQIKLCLYNRRYLVSYR